MTYDIFWRNQSRETPDFLYTFYIAENHWKYMDKANMMAMIRDRIIPGVSNEKADKAMDILRELQSD